MTDKDPTDETSTIPEGSFPEGVFNLVQRDFDDLHEKYCTDRQCVALKHEKREGVSLHASCHPDAGLKLSYADGVLQLRCSERDGYETRVATDVLNLLVVKVRADDFITFDGDPDDRHLGTTIAAHWKGIHSKKDISPGHKG